MSLRGAVERSLFAALASASPPAPRTRLEQEVARRLAGEAAPESRPRALAARAAFVLAGLRDRRLAPPRGTGDGPVCFVLDHPKFEGFVAPVAAALSRDARVLHYELPPSEAPRAARALGRGLWQYAFLASGLDRLVETLQEHDASAVVAVEGNSPVDEVAREAARLLGIPAIALQQGWSPFLHTGFRNMSWDRMAVWGEGFAELLRAVNPDTTFVATGSPALGSARASRLGTRPAVAFFLQTTSAVIFPEHLEELYRAVELTAARLPGVAVLVREHPGAPVDANVRARLAAAPNVVWAPAAEWSLQQVLDATNVAVAIYSTSLLEGAALGVPAVIVATTSLPPFEPDLEALGVGRRARSAEAIAGAAAVLLDEVGRPARAAAFRAYADRWFAGADGRGAERMAAVIQEQVEQVR